MTAGATWKGSGPGAAWAWRIAGAALVVVVPTIEYAGGPTLRLSVLYLLPVCLVAWFSGLRDGLITSLCAAVAFLMMDFALGRTYPEPMFRYWNLEVRLSIFLASAWGLSWLRRDLRERGELIERLNDALAEGRRARSELEENARELARSNEELEQYAHVVAHDLRSPLVAIGGYLQLLARRVDDAPASQMRTYIARSSEGVRRMEALIEDLLTYSKVGAAEQVFEATDCNAAMKQVLADLRGAIEESGAGVTSDPLPVLPFRRGHLAQLLQNLVGNAIKYRGQKPPRIHVSAESKGGEWVFSVRDNGVGVPPEHAEEIFGMLKRSSHTRDIPGTGIGLAICKKIVEGHGGRIWVESRAAPGATFRFTLPLGKVSHKAGAGR